MSWGLLSRVRHTINHSHPLGFATTTKRSTPFVSPRGEQISSAVGCSWTEFQRAVILAPGILATNRRSDSGDPSIPGSDRLSDILKVEGFLDGVGHTSPWAGQELSVAAVATNVRGPLRRDPADSILFRRLLVLVSQGRECSVSLFLTDPDQRSAPEAAVQHLLRAARLPIAQLSPILLDRPPVGRPRSFQITSLKIRTVGLGRNRRTSRRRWATRAKTYA